MSFKNFIFSCLVATVCSGFTWGSAEGEPPLLLDGPPLGGGAGAGAGGAALPLAPALPAGLTDAEIINLVRGQLGLPAGVPVILNQADADRIRLAYQLTATNRMFMEEVNTLIRWLRVDEWSSMGLHLTGAFLGGSGVIVSAYADNEYLNTTFGSQISGILGLVTTGILATITAVNTVGAYMSSAAKGRRGELAARGVSTVAQPIGAILPVVQPIPGGGAQVAQQ